MSWQTKGSTSMQGVSTCTDWCNCVHVSRNSAWQLITTWLSSCRYFDFDKLAEITQQVAKNLNKIIDINFYPVETARRSNMRNRPIGIGVQVSIPIHSEFALGLSS